MKINGLHLSLVRGETVTLILTLSNQGQPFILPPEGLFESLSVRFRVKKDPYTIITSGYVMDKELFIDEIHRFDDDVILNIKEFIILANGDYSPLYWAGCTLPNNEPFPNKLFFHPDLKQHAYYKNGEWSLYKGVSIAIPFSSGETIGLDYGDYYYDIMLEGKNTGVDDYVVVLVPQSTFTVSYRV